MDHTLTDLLDGMSSPDPAVRDGWAYAELAEGIASGRFAGDHEQIRRSAMDNLRSPEVQARTFAPLVLRWLVLAGDRDRAAYDAVRAWYLAENDTRGRAHDLGWLHAVAHGADYLAGAAAHGVADPREVLDVLARRTVRGALPWTDQEEARVARAVLLALDAAHRSGRDGCSAFLTPLEEAIVTVGESDDFPPVWLSNASALLTMLYLACSEQPLPGTELAAGDWSATLRRRCAGLASMMTPWLVEPSR